MRGHVIKAPIQGNAPMLTDSAQDATGGMDIELIVRWMHNEVGWTIMMVPGTLTITWQMHLTRGIREFPP